MNKNVFETLTMSTVTSKSGYLGKEILSERKSLKQSINDFTVNDTLRVSIDRKIQKRSSALHLKPLHSEDRNEHSLNSEQFLASNYKLKQISHSNSKRKKSTALDNNTTNINKDGFIRKDAYGNIIIKGRNKKQRISFQDDLLYKNKNDKKFIEIIDIQSYKKFNEDTSGDMVKKKKSGKCVCAIF